MGLKFNMFGYDDERLNDAILALMASPKRAVQARWTVQAGGVQRARPSWPAT